MRYTAIFATLCLVLTLASSAGAKQIYEARTRVMDVQSHLKGGDRERHIGDLLTLAKSQTVVSRTAETLSRLQATTDPDRVLSTLDIEPVKDSNVLVIKVKAESEDLARVTADVLATEFILYYDEFSGNKSGKPALRVLETAKTGPAQPSFRIFGHHPIVLAYIVGFVLIGVIIGIPIGIMIGKRRGSKET